MPTRRPSPKRRSNRSLPVSLALSASLIGAACGREPQPSQPPAATTPAAGTRAAPETRTLTADTSMKTPSGATFLVPKGWHVTEHEGKIVLEEPDRELRVVLLESGETDLGKAIEAGFEALDPGFARKLETTRRPPATDGWDEIQEHEYELLTNERRVVWGLARRKGGRVYLALVDGGLAASERRGAEVRKITQSFRAPGVEEESWKGRSALPLGGDRLAKLETFIDRATSKLGVPGAAIAVVQGGRVVFEKGVGVREKGKKAPVTPRTLFMVGSITKSLTSLLMAAAVDAGKMSWDTPVRELPFRFDVGDPDLSRKMRIKHTVCACTGLPPQDLGLFFEPGDVAPKDHLRLLSSLKPTTELGETFQYSNLLVAAGGWATGQVFGRTKDEDIDRAFAAQLQARVLSPIGMTSSTLDMEAAAKAEHASPHSADYKLDTAAMPLSIEEDVKSIRPAGALWSNVRDMARYVLVELGEGKTPEGRRVVSEASLLARREPQVRVGDKGAYGLAMMMDEAHDVRAYGHTGLLFGFASQVLFLPDHDVGWVVLTNAGTGAALHEAVKREMLALLFGAKEKEAYDHVEYTLKSRKDDAEKAVREIQTRVDPSWARELTGTYEHAGLGTMTLSADGGAVTIRAGKWRSRAGQKTESDGTRKLVFLDPPLAGFGIVPRQEGDTPSLLVETPQQTYLLGRRRSGDSRGGR